ncbi:hypothetical protein BDQ17DRAFT_1391542 [Cyathus striatus]|nr:hypothetical protein BDQ17DRAFT_1391542 [Cyathus striatus]
MSKSAYPKKLQLWQPSPRNNTSAHDEPHGEPTEKHKTYFKPSKSYCVETLCAPCGVVIAWTKFMKSESPTEILKFINNVYPTPESHPAYFCIDKACVVLRTVANQEEYHELLETSQFVVDSYHYNNHKASDRLCQEYCNPAPRDGSAPNLVIIDYDNNGTPYYKHAFNTQACEQLNAWLAGFESILKRMTPSNFNWFLHTKHSKKWVKISDHIVEDDE